MTVVCRDSFPEYFPTSPFWVCLRMDPSYLLVYFLSWGWWYLTLNFLFLLHGDLFSPLSFSFHSQSSFLSFSFSTFFHCSFSTFMDVLSSLTSVLWWKLSCKVTRFSLCQKIKEKHTNLREASKKCKIITKQHKTSKNKEHDTLHWPQFLYVNTEYKFL